MTPSGQTVCLCMIVKDEAPVIRRCLDSVRALIDHWVIVDTGSTDGTQAIVREHLRDVPGELVERPWRDFAHNRSEALALARPHGTYSLIIDADDAFEVPAGFALPDLDADSYTVNIRDTAIAYQRVQLVRSALPWRYVGVLHEFITCDGAGPAGHLDLTMVRNHDGARRRATDTYRRDAALLERALREETDPFLRSRYTFYLAQSYRDCGEREKAVARYLERAGLGFWDQEVFVSLYEAARQMEALGRPDEEVLRTYERATTACPARIEAAHGAARLCRNAKAFARGYAIADAARGRPLPEAGLFVEPWIYAYGLDDELSVLAYWSGHDRDAAEAAERALASPLLPVSERGRLEANRRFALDRLAKAGPSAAPVAIGWAPTRPQGGTELMVEALRGRLGPVLDAIDLRVNLYDPATRDARPLVLWFHHDIDQAAVQWCRDRALTDPVARFVFISYWQRERYVSAFGLPPERCVVIKYAMEPAPEPRRWEPAPVFRCAYTSTPFRGLDILLDVWERLPAGRAELHVWSSMKLYAMDDGPYRDLMERARTMPGVVYHGLAPNAELRAALRTMHFLTYPNTFAETACLSVMEAMSAGCRVIVPSHGVLPETTGGYARVYPWSPDRAVHAATFAETLEQEFAEPWAGRPEEALDQQTHCATIFAWARRLGEWRQLVGSLSASQTGTRMSHLALRGIGSPERKSHQATGIPQPAERFEGVALHICHVSLNSHDRIFDVTIDALRGALEDLGCRVTVAKNAVVEHAINIVVGALIFATTSGRLDFLSGVPYIAYQLEQLSPKGGHTDLQAPYMEFLGQSQLILEYSPAGMSFLQSTGFSDKARPLPPAYHPSLTRFTPAEQQDIDILFFGSPSERRTNLLNSIRTRGLNVVHAFDVYGSELDELIARTKIVINIHGWAELDILETVRLSYVIANRCFVISERGDHDPYEGSVTYASYDELEATCIDWIAKGRDARDRAAANAYDVFSRSSLTSDLRRALGASLSQLRAQAVDRDGGRGPEPATEPASATRADAPHPNLDTTGSRRARTPGVVTHLKRYDIRQGHTGIDYLDFIRIIAQRITPRSYLEIGTNTGQSLKQIPCDALCIDPDFLISQDVISRRERTFFFQMTSDDFFRTYDPRTFLTQGIDLSFLDGLHHFEATLRDFINIEERCHSRSSIVIHDCMPFNLPMTSREFRGGMWTGDVWRLLPIFKRYRPDLRVSCFDCPPTGLVLCSGLNPRSTVLRDNYHRIVDEFMNVQLDEDALQQIGLLYPYFDTRRLTAAPDDIPLFFG